MKARASGITAGRAAFFVRSVASMLFVGLLSTGLAAQMPDPKQMSGMPLPVGDLTPGSVSVRVIRGSLANVVKDQAVDLVVAGATRTARTDEAGRAEFTGLTPGTRVKAVTTVNGERIESQEFDVPSAGGIRVMLVATDPEMEKRAAEDQKLAQAPAQPGTVVFGDQTRFVFEMGDEALTGFYILQVLNTARNPVQTSGPVTVDLPDGAESATMMQGSSPQATVAGRRLTINGPFPPGSTVAQVAFTLPYSGGNLAVEQKLPVPLTQITLLAQKVGPMQVTSPQAPQRRDIAAEGDTYILGQGPSLKAGDTMTIAFSGLPHQPVWPRNLALALAALIVGAGVWASVRPGRLTAAVQERRRKLAASRDRLFAELTTIEEQHRAGTIDPERYGQRRRELVSSLERIYAELDEEAAA